MGNPTQNLEYKWHQNSCNYPAGKKLPEVSSGEGNLCDPAEGLLKSVLATCVDSRTCVVFAVWHTDLVLSFVDPTHLLPCPLFLFCPRSQNTSFPTLKGYTSPCSLTVLQQSYDGLLLVMGPIPMLPTPTVTQANCKVHLWHRALELRKSNCLWDWTLSPIDFNRTSHTILRMCTHKCPTEFSKTPI